MKNKRALNSSPFHKRPALRRRHSLPELLPLSSLDASSPPDSPSSPTVATKPSKRRGATFEPPRDNSLSSFDNIPDGCCPLCGIRLYKLPSNALFWRRNSKKKKAKPIHLPGRVENGRCLTCDCEWEDALLPPPSLRRQVNIMSMGDDYKTTPSTATTFVYQGDFNIYGQRHGNGQMSWANGDRFVGNFFNGLRDGYGSLYLRDGSEYTGEWELNKMHGQGVRHFVNKDVYVGRYDRGTRSGPGKMHFANGDLYAGNWANDLFDGFGRYFIHSTGQAMEGNFSQGKKHGKFKVQHADKTLDIFKFENDIIVGPGVRWSASRDKTWLLTNASGKQWNNQKMNKKRIPVAEAVSIGYECEAKGSIEPISIATLALEIPSPSRPQRNGHVFA